MDWPDNDKIRWIINHLWNKININFLEKQFGKMTTNQWSEPNPVIGMMLGMADAIKYSITKISYISLFINALHTFGWLWITLISHFRMNISILAELKIFNSAKKEISLVFLADNS